MEHLVEVLRNRFDKTEALHPDVAWADVLARLGDDKL